jgi:hypothetical protein
MVVVIKLHKTSYGHAKKYKIIPRIIMGIMSRYKAD